MVYFIFEITAGCVGQGFRIERTGVQGGEILVLRGADAEVLGCREADPGIIQRVVPGEFVVPYQRFYILLAKVGKIGKLCKSEEITTFAG